MNSVVESDNHTRHGMSQCHSLKKQQRTLLYR